MRILNIFSRYQQFGGEERFFYSLAEALAPIAEVHNFVYSTEELMLNGGPVKRACSMLNNKLISDRLNKLQPDHYHAWIIHNTFPAMSPAVYAAALKQNIPVIHYMHNYRMGCLNGLYYKNGTPCFKCSGGNFTHGILNRCWNDRMDMSVMAAATLFKTRRMGTLSRLSAYIAISNRQRELLIQTGIPENKLRIIPHFSTGNHQPLQTLGKNILFIGRLSPEKGVLNLLKAWKKAGITDRSLIIVGDGPERATLESYITRHALSGVRMMGFIPAAQHQTIRQECGLTIIPSVWEETFGLAVLESWEQGMPVLVTPCGGLPELVTHHRDGWVAQGTSPEALCSMLQTALAAEEQWSEMGQEGLHKTRTTYSLGPWREKMQQLFTDLSPPSTSIHSNTNPTLNS